MRHRALLPWVDGKAVEKGTEQACLKGTRCSDSTYPSVKMKTLNTLFHFASKSRNLDFVEFKS